MAKGGRRLHSGRHKKPTEMKLVQNTFRTGRHAGEVKVASQWPVPPEHLNTREKSLWAGLEAHCATWVASSDWPALNGVVSLMDRLLTIQAAMRSTPESGNPTSFKFTPSADGEPNMEAKSNHLYGLELKFWTALRGYIGLVGLSPVDRARVQAHEPEQAENPLERFITRKR